MKEIVIGNRKVIEIPIDSEGCRKCFFYNFTNCFDIRQLIGECDSTERKDQKSVIFKELK